MSAPRSSRPINHCLLLLVFFISVVLSGLSICYGMSTNVTSVLDETPGPVDDSSNGTAMLRSSAGGVSEAKSVAVAAAALGLITPLPLVSLIRGDGVGGQLTACELTTGRRLTVVKSAGFPTRYSPNVRCRYTVKRHSEAICYVTFLFNVLELEDSKDCWKDYVQLDGEKLCGSKASGLTRNVPFTDSEVHMYFKTDGNSSGGLGFMVTVVQQSCPAPSCDHRYTELHFAIQTPDFPQHYGNQATCNYTVVKSSPLVCRLRLEVMMFDVEFEERCQSDYLEIAGEKLCGSLPEGQIVYVDFPGDELEAHFRSDFENTSNGFHIEVQQEICSPEIVGKHLDETNSTEANSLSSLAPSTELPSSTQKPSKPSSTESDKN